MRTAFQKTALLTALALLVACQTIASFSQRAYEQATSLKVDALTLMDKANEPFAKHRTSVDTLKLNLEKAYEYAKGRPRNEITAKQWEIIKDPQRNSLGGFLRRWETESVLGVGFIQEAKKLVSDGFDAVIELESGKRKPSEGNK